MTLLKSGMRKNCVHYIKKINNELDKARKTAKQGEFFFANYLTVTGDLRKAPVFVVGSDNDDEDIIICSCTSKPSRTPYDIKVNLKKETYVRTNKIYTISRESLLFKIPQEISHVKLKEIMTSVKSVLNCE